VAGAAGEDDAELDPPGSLLGLPDCVDALEVPLPDVAGDGVEDWVGDGVGEGVCSGSGEGVGDGEAVAATGSAWHWVFAAAAAWGASEAACAVLPSTPTARKPPLSNPAAAIRRCAKRISIACLRCSQGYRVLVVGSEATGGRKGTCTHIRYKGTYTSRVLPIVIKARPGPARSGGRTRQMITSVVTISGP
jgi:hypothetical protein